jgi:hypothetical protein
MLNKGDVMLGIIIWGAFLYAGAIQVELKWALVVSLGAAVAFTLLGGALMQNSPLCGGYTDCSLTLTAVAYNIAIKFATAMLCYGTGRAGAAIFDRIRRAANGPTT